jgi:phosphate transport system substrate-binding protein
VLNPSGKFVKASTESIAAACQAAEAPRWNNFSASLTNVQGADSFPITSFTWVYLRIPSSDAGRTVALVDLLNWIYTDGQQFAVQEGYSALPSDLLAAVRKKVKSVQ